jgi:hypothetical protein
MMPWGAVLMLQRARQRNANDFHVIVRVGAKAHARGHGVVVEHAQHPKLNPLRVGVAPEAESVVGVEPAVAGVRATVGGVKELLHDKGSEPQPDCVFKLMRQIYVRTSFIS